jgi:hypothetical protein
MFVVRAMHRTAPRPPASQCAVAVCMGCVPARKRATASQAIRASTATLVRGAIRWANETCVLNYSYDFRGR